MDGTGPAPIARSLATRGASVVTAVLAIAIGARLSLEIPGSAVPQTAQTLAVVLVGAALGARVGTLALVAYLAVGAIGLPVFADGASGLSRLWGPTAGYLVGFVGAAGGVGWLREHGRLERFPLAVGAMLAAHALILLVGGLWLGRDIGLGTAYEAGVAPFLLGGAVKSVLAAASVVLVRRLLDATR